MPEDRTDATTRKASPAEVRDTNARAAMAPSRLVEALLALAPNDDAGFDALAQEAWRFQRARNPIYARLAGDTPWNGWASAPLVPIEAFKLAPVATFPPDEADVVFRSSGTGTGTRSAHYVRHTRVYEDLATEHFRRLIGDPPVHLVAWLPQYAPDSSLVHMVRHFTDVLGTAPRGFATQAPSLLAQAIAASEARGTRLVLFGAAFGLLDLLDEGAPSLPSDAIIVETGGMKTHRRAIDRATLHERLADGFGVPTSSIWSEYGMCELTSQAYATGGAVFRPAPWMRVRVVDPLAPTRTLPPGEPGALAVFDLGNWYSASPILTEDRAVMRDGGFEVLGRLTGAELRGCNFLLEQ